MRRQIRGIRSRNGRQSSSHHLELLEPRQLLSAAVKAVPWVIKGDADRAAPNDVISVVYNTTTQEYDLTINGVAKGSRPAARVRSIVIYGGKGDDTITVTTNGLKTPAIVHGGPGNDTITTGDGNDVIYGDEGNDTLNGGAGHDRIHGGSGQDTIAGGDGNDVLYGNTGNDTLDGGAGNDRLDGGAGDDILIGGTGRDLLVGGAGSDTMYGVKGTDKLVKDRRDTIIEKEQADSATDPKGPIIILPGPWNPSPVDSTAPQATISPELWQRLVDEAVARNGSLFGTGYVYYPQVWACNSGGGTTRSDVLVSDTNTQEAGVDEADWVETDGNYIYTLSNRQLTIVDVRDPANAHVESTMVLDGAGLGLYLVGGRLVVLQREGSYSYSTWLGGPYMVSSCIASIFRSTGVAALVFDVSDPAQPAAVSKTVIHGDLVDSRVVGNQVYMVIRNDLRLPAPQVVMKDTGIMPILIGSTADPEKTPYRYQTEGEYRQWLLDNKDGLVPDFKAMLADGTVTSSGSLVESSVANQSAESPLDWTTTVVDIDVTDPTGAIASKVAVAGGSSVIYATQQNLYLFSTNTQYFPLRVVTDTTVAKIALGVGDVHFVDDGHFDGRPLNSYSIDEYNGQLRVVTIGTRVMDYNLHTQTHTLYVLSDTGTSLAVTGKLENLGEGEDLRSVLFVQDRAFVVTFRRVDPLFAIDLSDPANPVAAGELVLPGYSSYLYAIDSGHLIGIGYGPTAANANWVSAPQISLFDVSDLANPKLVDQRLYNDTWGCSAAQNDPHAFSYFADEGVLAIPLQTGPGTPQNHLIVFKVDPATGFTDLGTVDASAWVSRSLRIGDDLYSLSATELKIVKMLDPSQVIADVALPEPPPVQLPPIQPINIGTLTLGSVTLGSVTTTGGVLTLGGGSSSGAVNISGGTLSGGVLSLSGGSSGGSALNVNGGTLLLSGGTLTSNTGTLTAGSVTLSNITGGSGGIIGVSTPVTLGTLTQGGSTLILQSGTSSGGGVLVLVG